MPTLCDETAKDGAPTAFCGCPVGKARAFCGGPARKARAEAKTETFALGARMPTLCGETAKDGAPTAFVFVRWGKTTARAEAETFALYARMPTLCDEAAKDGAPTAFRGCPGGESKSFLWWAGEESKSRGKNRNVRALRANAHPLR